jgi:hypothetical protein
MVCFLCMKNEKEKRNRKKEKKHHYHNRPKHHLLIPLLYSLTNLEILWSKGRYSYVGLLQPFLFVIFSWKPNWLLANLLCHSHGKSSFQYGKMWWQTTFYFWVKEATNYRYIVPRRWWSFSHFSFMKATRWNCCS